MAKKRVTSKMVAQHAGVSQTTVSFVLNKVEGQNISEETQRRVLDAAHELGYVPDATARNLARGISDNVGLVLTKPHEAVLSDEYVSYILTGISQIFRKQELRILVEFIDEDRQADTYRKLAHGNEVAGLLVIPYNASSKDIETMMSLSTENFPIVSLGFLNDTIQSVSINDVDGVIDALQHLYDLGHRSIAAISYAPEKSAVAPFTRLQAYKRFLAKHHLEYREEFVKFGVFTPESGYQATLELLNLSEPPTAIFALNDVMAFGAMSAIQESGYRIPQDLAVVGYDGIHLARYATPSLTTIEAPNVEQGHYAAEMLLKLINGKRLESRHIQLQPKLVIRDSCGYNLKHSR